MFRIDKASVGIRGGAAMTLPTMADSAADVIETPTITADIDTPPPGESPEEVLQRAHAQSSAILAKADEDARYILQQAYIQCDSIKNDAWQEGFTQGREEGEAKAREVYAEELNILATMIERVAALRGRVIDDIEDDCAALALDVAGKILHLQLERDDQAFLSLIRHALAALKASGKVSLRVSPAEYKRFFNEGEALYSLSTDALKVTAVQDEALEPYACVIDSDSGSINAGVMTQLRAAARAFE